MSTRARAYSLHITNIFAILTFNMGELQPRGDLSTPRVRSDIEFCHSINPQGQPVVEYFIPAPVVNSIPGGAHTSETETSRETIHMGNVDISIGRLPSGLQRDPILAKMDYILGQGLTENGKRRLSVFDIPTTEDGIILPTVDGVTPIIRADASDPLFPTVTLILSFSADVLDRLPLFKGTSVTLHNVHEGFASGLGASYLGPDEVRYDLETDVDRSVGNTGFYILPMARFANGAVFNG